MILDGIDLNVTPLGVDRAFDQTQPTHDVDFAIRRARYGVGADGGFATGLSGWGRAGIPYSGYLFMRGKDANVDATAQADALIRSLVAAGIKSAVVDWERDSGKGFDFGFPTVDDLQTVIDRLDAAGYPVMVYFSEGTAPGRKLRHVTAYWIANYVRKPKIHADCWQWTSTLRLGTDPGGIDRSVWLGGRDLFRAMFPGAGPVVVPVPTPPAAPTGADMTNLVPMTLHRVLDVPVGTVFRVSADPKADRQAVVGPDPNDPAAKTRAFGMLGAGIGTPEAEWYNVANGDRGVWVRRTDVTGVRTADITVGV